MIPLTKHKLTKMLDMEKYQRLPGVIEEGKGKGTYSDRKEKGKKGKRDYEGGGWPDLIFVLGELVCSKGRQDGGLRRRWEFLRSHGTSESEGRVDPEVENFKSLCMLQ